MGMDAIALLGQRAGRSTLKMEKTALLPLKGIGDTIRRALTSGGKQLGQAAQGVRNFTSGAGNLGAAVAQPVKAMARNPKATAAGAAGLTAAGVGAKSTYNTLTADPHDASNLHWHNQALSEPGGWTGYLTDPIKSLASLAAGPEGGPTQVESQGQGTYNPATQKYERGRVMAPKFQGIQTRMDALNKDIGQREQMQRHKLENAEAGGGTYSGTFAAQQEAQRKHVAELKKQLDTGDYGAHPGFLGFGGDDGVQSLRGQSDELRKQLEAVGLMGQAAGRAAPAAPAGGGTNLPRDWAFYRGDTTGGSVP